MSIVHVRDKDHFVEVVKSNGKVVVDFWAEWCGPCHAQDVGLVKLDVKFGDDIVIAKVDIDVNNVLAAENNIMSIPTLHYYVDGVQVGGALVGVQSYEFLENMVMKS